MNEKIDNIIDSDLLLSVLRVLKPVSEEDGKLITSYLGITPQSLSRIRKHIR